MRFSRSIFLMLIACVLATGVFLSQCSGGESVCTAMGCEDGVRIKFPELAPGDYRVTIEIAGKRAGHRCRVDPTPDEREETPGGAVVMVKRGSSCNQFLSGRPEQVRVTVQPVAGGRRVTRTFRPQYEGFRPNGPRCAPVCQQAVIEFR